MFGTGERLPSKEVWIQSLCRKSNAWDEALLGSRRQTHKNARAQRRMPLDIESASYDDYIGSNLGTGTPGTTCTGIASCAVAAHSSRGHAASQPMAIPSATGYNADPCIDVISGGHSEYQCSPSDLYLARNMWVPQGTPPAVEVSPFLFLISCLFSCTQAAGDTPLPLLRQVVLMHRTKWQGERYAWAVDLLNHAMAAAERARKSDAEPQGASPTTANIIARLNSMAAHLCDLDAPPAINLTTAPKGMYSLHQKRFHSMTAPTTVSRHLPSGLPRWGQRTLQAHDYCAAQAHDYCTDEE